MIPTVRFIERQESLRVRNGEYHDPAGKYQKLARAWESLFRSTGLSPRATIAEIAPGDEPKIALALERIAFQGTVYLVEPNARALASITAFYGLLLPRATVVPIPLPLAEATRELPRDLDGVFANHPLDDMILGKSLAAHAFHHVFTELYDRPIAEIRGLWEALFAAPHSLYGCLRETLADWTHLVSRLSPRRLGIAQYQSETLTETGFTLPDRVAISGLNRLRASLGATPAALDSLLAGQGRIPAHWLFVHREEGP